MARGRSDRLRVVVATNEPWGTYHSRLLLEETKRRGWELVQLVPDASEIRGDESCSHHHGGERGRSGSVGNQWC
jgi:hypothetical protein